MRKTKFKGVVDPGKVSHTKTDLSDSEMEPAYVKKYLKAKTPVKTVVQLALFGNPYTIE